MSKQHDNKEKICLRHQLFPVFQVLTGIFGVGAKTAARWIRDGIHTLPQLRDSGHALNRAQQAGACLCAHVCAWSSVSEQTSRRPPGLEHYDDVNQPVTRAEADAIGEIVEEAVASVLPGARVALTGGFRR